MFSAIIISKAKFLEVLSRLRFSQFSRCCLFQAFLLALYIKRMTMKTKQPDKPGDEAPELKHFVIVFVAVALLTAFSWIAWFKFGWFH